MEFFLITLNKIKLIHLFVLLSYVLLFHAVLYIYLHLSPHT